MSTIREYLSSLFSLSGKVAVIVGGTGELCGSMGMGLAKAGAKVLLVGRDEEKAKTKVDRIKAEGGDADYILADATALIAGEAILEAAIQSSGKVDILINGAGANSSTPFFEISEEEFSSIVDVNVKAVFRCCQSFGSYMIDNEIEGSIINIGSMSGIVPLSRVFTYSLAKAAIHNLSKNLAREWAPHRIRVNTLVPGFFPAAQNRKVLTPERVENIKRHTPMKRFGAAEELIGATLLLASNGAASFITGEELVVDGGYSSMTI